MEIMRPSRYDVSVVADESLDSYVDATEFLQGVLVTKEGTALRESHQQDEEILNSSKRSKHSDRHRRSSRTDFSKPLQTTTTESALDEYVASINDSPQGKDDSPNMTRRDPKGYIPGISPTAATPQIMNGHHARRLHFSRKKRPYNYSTCPAANADIPVGISLSEHSTSSRDESPATLKDSLASRDDEEDVDDDQSVATVHTSHHESPRGCHQETPFSMANSSSPVAQGFSGHYGSGQHYPPATAMPVPPYANQSSYVTAQPSQTEGLIDPRSQPQFPNQGPYSAMIANQNSSMPGGPYGPTGGDAQHNQGPYSMLVRNAGKNRMGTSSYAPVNQGPYSVLVKNTHYTPKIQLPSWIGPHDVLQGDSEMGLSVFSNYAGNKMYREKIKNLLGYYRHSRNSEERKTVATWVYSWVTEAGGRFLRTDSGGEWEQLSDHQAIKKIMNYYQLLLSKYRSHHP